MIRVKYVARRPRADRTDDDGDYMLAMSCTVVEEDSRPIETGLLDRHGVPLYRVREREPVGFRVRR